MAMLGRPSLTQPTLLDGAAVPAPASSAMRACIMPWHQPYPPARLTACDQTGVPQQPRLPPCDPPPTPPPAGSPHLLQSNAPILPIMLATKLLPEMEAEERALLEGLAAEQQQRGGGGSGDGGADAPQLSLAEQFAWVQDEERELNHLIDALVREEEGLLGAKGPRRRELAAAAAQAAAAAPPAPRAAQGLPTGRGGGQQPATPDPLLAAVAHGAGLA